MSCSQDATTRTSRSACPPMTATSAARAATPLVCSHRSGSCLRRSRLASCRACVTGSLGASPSATTSIRTGRLHLPTLTERSERSPDTRFGQRALVSDPAPRARRKTTRRCESSRQMHHPTYAVVDSGQLNRAGPSGKQSMTWRATSRARVVFPHPARPTTVTAGGGRDDRPDGHSTSRPSSDTGSTLDSGASPPEPGQATSRRQSTDAESNTGRLHVVPPAAHVRRSERSPSATPAEEKEHRTDHSNHPSPRLGGLGQRHPCRGLEGPCAVILVLSHGQRMGRSTAHSPKPVAACFGLWSRSGQGRDPSATHGRGGPSAKIGAARAAAARSG